MCTRLRATTFFSWVNASSSKNSLLCLANLQILLIVYFKFVIILTEKNEIRLNVDVFLHVDLILHHNPPKHLIAAGRSSFSLRNKICWDVMEDAVGQKEPALN